MTFMILKDYQNFQFGYHQISNDFMNFKDLLKRNDYHTLYHNIFNTYFYFLFYFYER